MVAVHNFSYGLVNPVLGYVMSCLGAFLGLRCVTRARAHTGGARACWLVLAAISLGAAGIWSMHFIAMLGFTIPGQTILYNVPITIVSPGAMLPSTSSVAPLPTLITPLTPGSLETLPVNARLPTTSIVPSSTSRPGSSVPAA